MFYKVSSVISVIVLGFILSGCLTCERKEYVFKLTGEHTGRLTIRYINIFSNSIDSVGELKSDMDELMEMWFKGQKIEKDFPKATHFRKRLFEQDGQLCGEITMDFKEFSDVRLFQYRKNGPIMFSMSAVNDDGENFQQSNGDYGGEMMPVLFWPNDAENIRFSTYIAKPDSTTVSLLDMWKTDNGIN